jgi:ketosteroid isomerase-like protein
MRTRLIIVATLIVTGVLTAGLSGFYVAAAEERDGDEAEVLRLDQKIADAVVRGDTAYVASATSADFVMVHGDGWTNGGKPLATDTKESMLKRVTSKYYDVIDFDSVKVEMHGDVAITYGRYIAHTTGGAAPDKRWFSVWFERVYAKQDGKWVYLSHRTVHGPTPGPDRQSVRDK